MAQSDIIHMPNTRLLFSNQEITKQLERLSEEINKCYPQKMYEDNNIEKPVALCVLKGAVFFFTDLIRKLEIEFEIDFIKLSSYAHSQTSSGSVVLVQDTKINLTGRDVLIVEDIIDSGHSMDFLSKELKKRGAKSIRIATLVDKKERRELKVNADFVGFEVAEGFIVGYGMDYAEHYRTLTAMYEIIPE